MVRNFQRGGGNRPLNPIIILTGKELFPESYWGGFKTYEDKIKPNHKFEDYLGAIAEFSIIEYLHIPNWWEVTENQRQENITLRKGIRHIIKALMDRGRGV